MDWCCTKNVYEKVLIYFQIYSFSFFSGIRYLPGGVASGFHHTDVNPTGTKKLYQVKGKKNIRVIQV